MIFHARHHGPESRPDLRALFDVRKASAFGKLDAFRAADCSDESKLADLIRLLHQLAGTAGMFGAWTLGSLAAEGVENLREAPASRRQALIVSLRSALSREGRS